MIVLNNGATVEYETRESLKGPLAVNVREIDDPQEQTIWD